MLLQNEETREESVSNEITWRSGGLHLESAEVDLRDVLFCDLVQGGCCEHCRYDQPFPFPSRISPLADSDLGGDPRIRLVVGYYSREVHGRLHIQHVGAGHSATIHRISCEVKRSSARVMSSDKSLILVHMMQI
jgi:hypothetical protein